MGVSDSLHARPCPKHCRLTVIDSQRWQSLKSVTKPHGTVGEEVEGFYLFNGVSKSFTEEVLRFILQSHNN